MNNLTDNNLRRAAASIFLFALIALLTACGDQPVASTDNETEANIMFDLLNTKGLHVKKEAQTGEKKGWQILVDEGLFGENEQAVATQVLNDYGLPRPKEVLTETTNPYGMTSPEEAKKRQNREKEIQINNHLYNLTGVTTASVIIAQPDNDVFSLQKTPPTASVVIVQNEPQPKFTIEDVQRIVSTTVPELKPENITVAVTQQIPREVPLAQLEARRRTNKIFAGGIALIVLLAGTLAAVWFTSRRRKRLSANKISQLPAYEETEQLAENAQPSLAAANDDVL